MSWLQRLTETYDACFGQDQFAGIHELSPVGSVPQKTQLHITLWNDGSFCSARLEDLENTTMFVTEDSAGRSGTVPAANPLTEQLEYCAKGMDRFGGKPDKHQRFATLLGEWCSSAYSDAKVETVHRYIKKGSLLEDLLKHKVLVSKGAELEKVKVSKTTKLDPSKLWVRWTVYGDLGDKQVDTWSDKELSKKWSCFEEEKIASCHYA